MIPKDLVADEGEVFVVDNVTAIGETRELLRVEGLDVKRKQRPIWVPKAVLGEKSEVKSFGATGRIIVDRDWAHREGLRVAA